MSKTEELQIIDRTIANLGDDSYLGPWLAGIRNELESCIRSDFCPTLTLADASHQADAIVQAARIEAQQIVAAAEQEAKRRHARVSDYQQRLLAANDDARRLLSSI